MCVARIYVRERACELCFFGPVVQSAARAFVAVIYIYSFGGGNFFDDG